MSLKHRLKKLEQAGGDPLVAWLSQEMDRIAEAAAEGRELPAGPMSWQERELLKQWGILDGLE